jgi:arginine utilization protein RocB
MPWYEQAFEESVRRKSQSASIYREAEKVYNAIWDAIVQEMNQLHSRRQQSLQTNGSAFERTIKQPISPRYDEGDSEFRFREMLFKLSGDRKAIIAMAASFEEYPPAKIEFDLEQSKDGIVRPIHKGTPVETHEAAIMVLRHFLFPDLPAEREKRSEFDDTLESVRSIRDSRGNV